MNAIGTVAELEVMKIVTGGAYLDGGKMGEVFVPRRDLPGGAHPGDRIKVFVYRDSEAVLTGTTSIPRAQLGQCAFMKVVSVTRAGAFVDWGLSKDLFVPASEQYKPLEEGRSYVILVYLDERTGRLAGTAKLHSHLGEDGSAYTPGQQVNLLVCGFSELGFKVVVDNALVGLIFRDDAPGELRYGQDMKGYVKAVRPDGKLDLSLLPPGLSGLDLLGDRILEHLRANGGSSPLTDKSSSWDIGAVYGVSKSAYKKALGRLYKQRKVRLEPDKVVLVD
jgi:predicted RNA-binding protein (virulence factor B family)